MDAKAPQKDLQSLLFTPNLAKPENLEKLGDEEPAHKMTERNKLGRLLGEVETSQKRKVR